jgi:hypothetical protein
MRLALESPAQPDVLRLIDALDAYQRPLYPPASHHGIDLAALLAPAVIFGVARDDEGAALGACWRLAICKRRPSRYMRAAATRGAHHSAATLRTPTPCS